MNSIRKHLSYANIVATLALLFAMSGGALAAKHYLVNSTKQISPKVLKKLKGHTGPAGAQGAQGAQGPQGSAGLSGANGLIGPSGVKGANGATHVVVRTRVLSVGGGTELQVDCEPGERATGGGVSFTDGSAGGGSTVTQSAPAERATGKVSAEGETPTAWKLGFDGTGVAESVTFSVICASP